MTMQDQMLELFTQMAASARSFPERAAEVRDALLASGILEVFKLASAHDDENGPDILDLLDAAGEAGLRARLDQLTVAEMKKIIKAHNYDPGQTLAKSRSINKLVTFIVKAAQKELEAEAEAQQEQPLAGSHWLL